MIFCRLLFCAISLVAALAGDVPVTTDNFVRAETHRMMQAYVDKGAFGGFTHIRLPTPLDEQNVIRMNRDTLYSAGIFDLSTPLTIEMPNSGNRFMSLLVINEDHHTPVDVQYGNGTVTLTEEKAGSRYVFVIIRTFVDPSSPQDLEEVHKLQDAVTVTQAAKGSWEVPQWNQEQLKDIRDAALSIAKYVPDFGSGFGKKGEVNPVTHFLVTAFGWGGNPKEDATYVSITPPKDDGKTAYTLTLENVPVDGFWSVTVYNKDGFLEENEHDSYNVNNVTAQKGEDGRVVIHFGGDPTKSNFIPITEGWNAVLRLYRPRAEVLDGSWTAPELVEVSADSKRRRRLSLVLP
uniref:DUF1214 domain-containing protein n=1 Tax=Chromera velia CCMP2878 TaxID=1169474 RepID=A0A0G4GCA7_9ALVE|mmetsp:Transcript_34362/g.67934  ORF Transcript_34362/g.67934 Transcript_34362/m.67934 type:complete len:348 (+) Transcript_34362:112-1155(+)|eukprot:Cvel_4504.t1-p1 / transcript=Cvel_4504.t1 / gene=Cvel_4504 / organism=Chromera_velia_CCMP2878 / gene_product=hypothetical protein / transcript_product=hypothetical protein / location=Cvel_scaffold197:25823-28239(+) / protein_length=347 / sequence_SO=supercontig / SO=protein_coding / is_pseudo=false